NRKSKRKNDINDLSHDKRKKKQKREKIMMKNLEKVTKKEIGMRFDKFLTLKNPKNSRQEIQSWIKNGNVLVNGFVKKANYKVTNYDEIVWDIPQEVKRNIEPE